MARLASQRRQRDRGSKLIEPTTTRHFRYGKVHIALYAPWWSPSRTKRELGFMIRVMDPRAGCEHHCQPAWLAPECAWCPKCGARLRVKPGTMTIISNVPPPRWRWLKVFVAKTSPNRKRSRHGVFLAEIESHLTEGLSARITTKSFIRLKLGVGGRGV